MDINIEFFYGLSGTLKTTTISSRTSNVKTNYYYMPSSIKTWKELENGIFSGKVEVNDLNYAINHLCRLEGCVEYCRAWGIENLFVERGVTDMLFYKSKKTALEDEFIKDVVSYEDGLTVNNADLIDSIGVKKTLLIMKDRDFIIKSVNSHPSRQLFKDVDDYLAKQEEYVDFTRKYNNINNTITITSAKDYITGLGINYRSN
jgi:hypothetical protein